MKLFISTPAYGGMVTDSFTNSLMQCLHQAFAEGVVADWLVHFQSKESLIPRARNRAGLAFLESKFDKLLTIDADIVWTYDNFKRIITSDKDIVGGVYPLKCFPLVANFNPLSERGTELLKTNRGYDLEAFREFTKKYADSETGEAEVRHVPTGFLCVTQKVLAKLSETCEVYWTFQPDSGERKGFFDFYPSGVKEGEYLSEDWGFCQLAADAGFKIHINTKVLLGHIGSHQFRLGQFYGEADQ